MVADCGGGTVDLTVHQLEQPHGTLKELYKASGGPYGAVGVDLAFEELLGRIFGEDFIATFKRQRPAAWVDLTIAFEARKRTAGPHRAGALNISLPFSFIDFYRKQRGHNVETALRRSRWARGPRTQAGFADAGRPCKGGCGPQRTVGGLPNLPCVHVLPAGVRGGA